MLNFKYSPNNKRIAIALILIASFTISTLSANASYITNAALNSTADLCDIGGGTYFAFDSTGTNFGAYPWSAGGNNLIDNDETTYDYTQWNNGIPPAYAGIYGMTEAVALGSFVIGTYPRGDGWPNASGDFTIQGSNDTTNGLSGAWTDIFTYSGSALPEFKILFWASIKVGGDNVFDTEKYNSFRLVESAGYTVYSEIEFFAAPPPKGTVIIMR